jgi:hypothetical protein
MKRWHLIALGILIGFAVAGLAAYAFSRPIFNLFAYAPYVSAAAQGSLDVAVLRKLRAGDIAGAIETMEHRLVGEEITLSEYASTTPATRREPNISSAMAKIEEYRKEHPSPLPPNTSLERTRDR